MSRVFNVGLIHLSQCAVFLLLTGLSLGAVSVQVRGESLSEAEIAEFVRYMHRKYEFEQVSLTQTLQKARVLDSVLEKISRPAEGLPWFRYRDIFLKPERIEAGVAFWNEHEKTLLEAETQYGVPPEIMVAVIGVETFYGRLAGKDKVLDSLVTLGFRYPRRSEFFRSELESFLLLTRDEKLDAHDTLGSYAGAMGIPQFIPSSYRAYAVDFDGDNRRDLLNSVPDAIASVANYLGRHGWRRSEQVALPAKVQGTEYRKILDRGIEPNTSIAQLSTAGVKLYSPIPDNTKAALIEFELEDGSEYWVALQNFYVITRYNHSALYALAVYQLAEAIKELRNR